MGQKLRTENWPHESQWLANLLLVVRCPDVYRLRSRHLEIVHT